MTRQEAVSLLEGEIIRCRMAPKINGCTMTEDWQRTIDVCEIAIAAIREQEERKNPKPLTLAELKTHLSKRHPHEIEPLYIVFNPPIPVDYAPRWRDAYNLSNLVACNAEDYGKTWLAYRDKPKEDS